MWNVGILFIVLIGHLKQSSETEVDDRQYFETSRSLLDVTAVVISVGR